jgi:hypothetical protein
MKKLQKPPKTVEKVVQVVTEEISSIVDDNDAGYIEYLGKICYIQCSSYSYTGEVTGVNSTFIQVSNPSIVYETGPWNNKDWKDCQKLPTDKVTLNIAHIEAIFEVKK